jgi:hypothetical protein
MRMLRVILVSMVVGMLVVTAIIWISVGPQPNTEDQLRSTCNYHAEQNMRHFDLLLRTLHPGSSVTASDMQKNVVKLCMQGVAERDAYKMTANLLGGDVR